MPKEVQPSRPEDLSYLCMREGFLHLQLLNELETNNSAFHANNVCPLPIDPLSHSQLGAHTLRCDPVFSASTPHLTVTRNDTSAGRALLSHTR